MDLPAAVERAGRVLAFDDDGNITTLISTEMEYRLGLKDPT